MSSLEEFGRLRDEILNNVKLALAEDIGKGDITAQLISEEKKITAHVVAREHLVLCGTQWFDACFQLLTPDIMVKWSLKDGDVANSEQLVCKITGPARAALTAERAALNFLQTLSAVATQTQQYVKAVAGTGTTIVDTRKTIPGLRVAQKYAVTCGGGNNHRMGLYDAILIKENHIAAAGDIKNVMDRAHEIAPEDVWIQIEVESLEECRQALEAGAKIILLDNFTHDALRTAATLAKDYQNGNVILEASGNITLKNIRSVAETGVNRISVGALTKNVEAIDFSMRVNELD